jgi:hypothetical protein
VRVIDRVCEIPHEGPFCDLMWSDPEDVETWAVSPRGAGWLFGGRVTSEFNTINGLELICRAHQLVQVCVRVLCYRYACVCCGGGRVQGQADVVQEFMLVLAMGDHCPPLLAAVALCPPPRVRRRA